VFNWFNPFCYLMKHEIRLNLEYLADEAVLDRGNARKTISTTCLAWPITPQGVT
jgi:beta-lactamase regulating signal transducer with metallopeptidase domain